MSIISPEIEFIDRSTRSIRYLEHGWPTDLCRWHSHDEYAVVVSGKLEILLGENTHELAVGSYIVIPGSLGHAWTVPEGSEDAVILVRRAGPADFHFVE